MAPEQRTYVFIDESGDAGFKLDSGSSPVFCLIAILFSETVQMEATEAAIQELKRSLSRKRTQEFHFNKENEATREAFCKAVPSCPFRIRAIVVEKTRIFEDAQLRRSPTYFYHFFTRMLLEHGFGAISNARVYIDGDMNRNLKTYLRQALNKEAEHRIIDDTKFKDSKETPLIQLADMVAGARAYRNDDKRTPNYLNLLRARVEAIWEFGQKNG